MERGTSILHLELTACSTQRKGRSHQRFKMFKMAQSENRARTEIHQHRQIQNRNQNMTQLGRKCFCFSWCSSDLNSFPFLFLFWFLCCSHSGFSPVTVLVPFLLYPVLPPTWFCSCSDSDSSCPCSGSGSGLVLAVILTSSVLSESHSCPVPWFITVVPFLFWF